MKFFTWQPGRQEATKDILKFPIWSFFGIDLYLLKFPANKEVATHLDVVDAKKHFRLNITLTGEWILTINQTQKTQQAGDYHLFRPDIQEHSAKFIKTSLVLSIGWITS